MLCSAKNSSSSNNNLFVQEGYEEWFAKDHFRGIMEWIADVFESRASNTVDKRTVNKLGFIAQDVRPQRLKKCGGY